jgi:hypothetical protein
MSFPVSLKAMYAHFQLHNMSLGLERCFASSRIDPAGLQVAQSEECSKTRLWNDYLDVFLISKPLPEYAVIHLVDRSIPLMVCVAEVKLQVDTRRMVVV